MIHRMRRGNKRDQYNEKDDNEDEDNFDNDGRVWFFAGSFTEGLSTTGTEICRDQTIFNLSGYK